MIGWWEQSRIPVHMWLWPYCKTPSQSYSLLLAVQSLSCVRLFVTPWTAACQAFLSFAISQSLLKLMSIWSVLPSNHLILCRPFLLPSIFPSIRVFSKELALHIRWPKHWSFSISPSNEYSGLSSFRIDWFDLFATKGTLKSLLQHNLKASVLQCSAFFMVQLSHLYMATGETKALTRWTFVWVCGPVTQFLGSTYLPGTPLVSVWGFPGLLCTVLHAHTWREFASQLSARPGSMAPELQVDESGAQFCIMMLLQHLGTVQSTVGSQWVAWMDDRVVGWERPPWTSLWKKEFLQP